MSAFDNFNNDCFFDSLGTFGESSFVLDGKTYFGVHNAHDFSRDATNDGLGDIATSTMVCRIRQFGCGNIGELERSMYGKNITIQGRPYRVENASLDSISLTLYLSSQLKNK